MKRSRRQFLETVVAAPLAATALGGVPGLFAAEGLFPNASKLFPKPDIIRYDSHCFTIHGKDTLLHGGCFHYARCPRELWRDRLLKFKRAGFNTLETYIFWNYHEPFKGQVDLSELEAFIQAVEETGLWMLARPGPYACAEWDAGGFPHWILAEQFPLRSADPRSIATSQHWFNEVLPVIREHQITRGGPIILMQIENEYDFRPDLSDDERREYISALAHMAWKQGIEVPLFTCWTKQAREKSHPTMARLMDTCNFYPRWDIFPSVPDQLAKLRREQPEAPVGVTELQGGWFSNFGGKLSVDLDGVDGAQLNMLTKTVLESGATFFNYYMGFGGTNFDWAAHGITTTYDYAAPVREPGGLWEKYFEARGVASALNLFGDVLTRAETIPGCSTDNTSVAVSERANGKSGVVFVRETENQAQQFELKFVDPASPTHRKFAVPREGKLGIGARGMKMLPVGIPIAGGTLRYSTSDVLAAGSALQFDYLVAYDDPGQLVEIALATKGEPHVHGDYKYLYWDRDNDSVVIGVEAAAREKLFLVNDRLILIVAPRDRALRSCFPQFSDLGATSGKHELPLIMDADLLVESGSSPNSAWATLQLRPGEHEVTSLAPRKPSGCAVDGAPAEFSYDDVTHSVRFALKTPTLAAQSVNFLDTGWWIEQFDPQQGEWLNGELKPLDGLGLVPYGYVKYRAEFDYQGEPKLFVADFTENMKKVFLDGKLLENASSDQRRTEEALHGIAQPGKHTLEIAYESFGSFNFGKQLGELTGLKSVKLGDRESSAREIGPWQYQRYALPMRGRAMNPDFAAGGWKKMAASASSPSAPLVPTFTWRRAEFTMDAVPKEWFAPLQVTLKADRDALIYLNGKFVGRYVTVGPQKEFFLPDPFLNFGGQTNVLNILLAYTTEPGNIRTLRIAPYHEFAARQTRVEFTW